MPGPLIKNPEWQTLTTPQRFERMLGKSMDDCMAILDEPIDVALRDRDAVMLNTKIQIIRAVFHTCVKLGIEHRRLTDERDKVLAAMAKDLREDK